MIPIFPFTNRDMTTKTANLSFIHVLAFIVTCLVLQGSCDLTSEKIYHTIPQSNYSMCFRRLNATHQLGCSSSRGGDVGVLHLVATPNDMDWVLEKGPHAPYIPLFAPVMFNRENVLKLARADRVSGMLVIDVESYDTPQHFSADKTCPNEMFDAYTDNSEYSHCRAQTWNPQASELAFMNLDFPINIIKNKTEVDFLKECYEKYNEPSSGVPREYPLCAVSILAAMDAAKDTPTCIRRSNLITNLNPQTYCDPVGNHNVYAFVEPINNTQTLRDDSVTVVSARMDGFSLFYNENPSADSTISGLVTLLAASEVLGAEKKNILSDLSTNPLLFTLFNGEVFDYTGSSRFVYEMGQGNFPTHLQPGEQGPAPIDIHHIKHFVEVGQVGGQQGRLWVHTDPVSRLDKAINDQVKALSDDLVRLGQEAGLDVGVSPERQPLPPASFHTFLRERNMSGLVLSNYESEFTNQFYNSRYDAAENIGVVYPADLSPEERYDYVTEGAKNLTTAATTLARLLYKLTTGEENTNLTASSSTVTHLLYCYLVDPRCELFNKTLDKNSAKGLKGYNGKLVSSFVSISRATTSPTFFAKLARNLLLYFLGDHLDLNKTTCENQDSPLTFYEYVQGDYDKTDPAHPRLGLCLRGTANYSLARSPAFDIKNYDWTSNKYPSWTESIWGEVEIRVFLKPAHNYEVTLLCTSLALFVFALVMTYLINLFPGVIFQPAHSILD